MVNYTTGCLSLNNSIVDDYVYVAKLTLAKKGRIEWFDATLSANALKREEINYQCVFLHYTD